MKKARQVTSNSCSMRRKCRSRTETALEHSRAERSLRFPHHLECGGGGEINLEKTGYKNQYYSFLGRCSQGSEVTVLSLSF